MQDAGPWRDRSSKPPLYDAADSDAALLGSNKSRKYMQCITPSSPRAPLSGTVIVAVGAHGDGLSVHHDTHLREP